ncbi:uncharacterized protein K452DRAFT_310259 [Aplosporella prunicola CBS 121167]|uniref:PCI domain-containing protein n=1 Tax=Aplosporella prunicola CBS 121167 TaxID=1176127 RepID=A0A6A6B7K1_9PEZI|nr:uncharacterized protein K452DRAFT_310259 [Aplosporella prunicola CBS 121167]KAF2139886.1 hypothetical protein K452DRAFT_310259 [Aplosporella prunicola CBS 121167]
MEQTRALNALEPFLALSKAATSPRAAADLVTQATSAANTYVFAELLQAPTIQGLRASPEYAGHLRLLEVFSWGTWQDYTTAQPSLPALSPAQAHKLKLLSLLPLAADPANLTYASLSTKLEIGTTRALEDLLITAIHSGLIAGTLNPAAARVAITSAAPLRDLRPGAAPGMTAALGAWRARCDDSLAELEAQIAGVKAAASERAALKAREDRLRAKVEEKLDEQSKAGGKRGERGQPAVQAQREDEDDAMEVDEGEGVEAGQGRSTRSSKRGAFGGRAR